MVWRNRRGQFLITAEPHSYFRQNRNASAYFYDYKDKQLNGTIPGDIFVTLATLVNVPESEVWGVESDLSWAPNDNWFILGGVAYLSTEITKGTGFDPADGLETSLEGLEFALSPEVQATLLVCYNFDLNDEWNLRASFDVTYTDEREGQLGSSNPLFSIDAYTLYGMNVNLQSHDGLWEIGL